MGEEWNEDNESSEKRTEEERVRHLTELDGLWVALYSNTNDSVFLSSFSFSGFLTSVKSELRNRSSEYSDISDSEDSGPDCTALVRLEPLT